MFPTAIAAVASAASKPNMLATWRIALHELPGQRCLSCSVAVLYSFTSGCGVPIRFSVPSPASTQNMSRTAKRGIHSSIIQRNGTRKLSEIESPSENEIEASSEVASKEEQVPWFLRVETPRPPSHPFPKRELPPLPENSPPTLLPLLTQLSEELGILDLKIFDLRPLDPPPAIGAETIMILGSARSERHLHVSADKLCRWLRSEYQWSPYADGLLGRNELKLKNRRKRRRGKLGSTEGDEEDEFGRVGWVCVNVGKQGLVVQLFTPERREEINLEELWGGALARNQRRKEREKARVAGLEAEAEDARGENLVDKAAGEVVAGEVVEQEVSEGQEIVKEKALKEKEVKEKALIEVSAGSNMNIQAELPPPLQPRQTISSSTGLHSAQTRSLHTVTRRSRIETPDPESHWYTTTTFKQEGLQRAVSKGKIRHLFAEHVPSDWSSTTDPNYSSTNLLLRAHVNHLKNLCVGARTIGGHIIGDGPHDKSTTPFLKTFWSLIPTEPTPEQLTLILEFYIAANQFPNSGYTMGTVITHFRTMVKSGMKISPEIYYMLLKAIADTPEFRDNDLREGGDIRLTKMREVLDHMRNNYPYPPFTPEIAYCFLRALISSSVIRIYGKALHLCSENCFRKALPLDSIFEDPAIGAKFGNYVIDHRVVELNDKLKAFDFGYTAMEYHKLILTAYAMADHWTAFWNHWKHIRYLHLRRDEVLYSLAVGLLVMRDHQRHALKGVRHLWADMKTETPAVDIQPGLARAFWRLVWISEKREPSTEFVPIKKLCLKVMLEGEAKFGVEIPELKGIEVGGEATGKEAEVCGPKSGMGGEATGKKAEVDGAKTRAMKEPEWLKHYMRVKDFDEVEAKAVEESLSEGSGRYWS